MGAAKGRGHRSRTRTGQGPPVLSPVRKGNLGYASNRVRRQAAALDARRNSKYPRRAEMQCRQGRTQRK